MKSYKVTWEMEFEGDSPTKAAKKALLVHRDEGSLATYFTVEDPTGQAFAVDLEVLRQYQADMSRRLLPIQSVLNFAKRCYDVKSDPEELLASHEILLINLLTDLRHLYGNFEFEELDRVARRHFFDESAGPAAGCKKMRGKTAATKEGENAE